MNKTKREKTKKVYCEYKYTKKIPYFMRSLDDAVCRACWNFFSPIWWGNSKLVKASQFASQSRIFKSQLRQNSNFSNHNSKAKEYNFQTQKQGDTKIHKRNNNLIIQKIQTEVQCSFNLNVQKNMRIF